MKPDFTQKDIMYTRRGTYKVSFMKDSTGWYMVLPGSEMDEKLFSELKDGKYKEYNEAFGTTFGLNLSVPKGYLVRFCPYKCDDYEIKQYRHAYFHTQNSYFNEQFTIRFKSLKVKEMIRTGQMDVILFRIRFYKELGSNEVTFGPSLWEVM